MSLQLTAIHSFAAGCRRVGLGVMRFINFVALITVLGGCATAYDCAQFGDEPDWQLITVDPSIENTLLATVLEHRYQPLLSSLSSGFLWYRGAEPFVQQFLFCVPPTNHKVWKKAGCFAERYIFRQEGSKYVFVEEASVVCT